jgi:hypothetical protein
MWSLNKVPSGCCQAQREKSNQDCPAGVKAYPCGSPQGVERKQSNDDGRRGRQRSAEGQWIVKSKVNDGKPEKR